MIDNLEIRVIINKKEIVEALKIREEVFIKGQGVEKSREQDGLDDISTHVSAYIKGTAIGWPRIRFLESKAKLERIAVLKEFRNQGIGGEILNFMISFCLKKGIKNIVLHAQYYAKNFYKKFGFKEYGEIFQDAGIDHVEMILIQKEDVPAV